MSNIGNGTIAKSIHLFLWDHVTWAKVRECAQTIKQQLKMTVDIVPSDDTCTLSQVCCVICNNKDKQLMIVDNQQGFKCCLSSDGQGCGGVVKECHS